MTEAASPAASAPLCPYCAMPLAKMPVRKTKCPHCSNAIYLKRAPGSTNKRLMRQPEADAAEAQWRAYSHRKALHLRAQGIGVDAPEFDAALARAGGDEKTALIGLATPRAMKYERSAFLMLEVLTDAESAWAWRLMRLEIDLGRLILGLAGRRDILVRSIWCEDTPSCAECSALDGQVVTSREELSTLLPRDCSAHKRGGICAVRFELGTAGLRGPA